MVKPDSHADIVKTLKKIDSINSSELSKQFSSEHIQKFTDSLIKTMLVHIKDVFSVFVEEKRPKKINDLPKLFNEFITDNAHVYEKDGNKKKDYNLLYLKTAGNSKRGKLFFQFKELAYDQILDNKFRFAQDLQAEKVLNDIIGFLKNNISKRDDGALLFFPKEVREYMQIMIDKGQLEIGIIDLVSGMTDRYAQELFESIGRPINFRRSA